MTDGYARWAQQYRSRLWTGVLPLPPRAKKSVPKGYTGRSGAYPDDQQIEAWCRRWVNGNIALRMPGDVIGIDVDAYPYEYEETDPETGETYPVTGMKTGDRTLAALEAELGPLPATWRSSSRGDGPSGIRVFKVPPGLLWGDFGLHLECVWWAHRYAVVYPSINPDSEMQYQWIDDTAHEPRWGVEPPKVTDITELPESWVARFGRAADQPKTHRTASDGRRVAAGIHAPGDARQFTRQQAAAFVQPELDKLRGARLGEINDRLNDAAITLSHFVPAFWSDAEARIFLQDALDATVYDDKRSADATMQSGLTALSWVAELIADQPPRTRNARQEAAEPEAEPAADEPAPDDGMDAAIEGFWDRRPFLRYLNQYARSKYVAPWAVLGSTLALAAAAVEPNIYLPPIIGKEASLNLFVGLVGPSGGGKDIAFGVAEELLDVRFGDQEVKTEIIPLGSGEGISHVYMKHPPKLVGRRSRQAPDEDSQLIGLAANNSDEPIQYRTRALLTISEIDTLDAQTKRQGSTVGGQLRQGWSGSQIGFHYADTAKRMIVPKHSYRMCLVAGIQPGRAQMLLSGPESDGGTPQRFLWLPATDPTMTRDAPPTPARIQWNPPVYQGRAAFDVCPQADDVIVDAHVARNRGDGDALDGHALLTRLKVAAALAMLDDREPRMQCTVTDEDWDLAGIVMAVSDRTRESVRRHLAEAAKVENEKRAYAEAQKTIVITETVENAALGKAQKWVRGRIGQEWVTLRTLTQAIKSTIRSELGVVLERMVGAGEIESEEYANPKGGPGGVRYRRK